MTLERVNPDQIYKAHGFAHAVVATGSRIVFIGGQVASDLEGQVLAHGDYEKQAEIGMRNVALAVEAAGATMGDLAQLTIFIVDNNPERQDQVLAGLGTAAADIGFRRCAMKIIGVQALGSPVALVEYDGIAVAD